MRKIRTLIHTHKQTKVCEKCVRISVRAFDCNAFSAFLMGIYPCGKMYKRVSRARFLHKYTQKRHFCGYFCILCISYTFRRYTVPRIFSRFNILCFCRLFSRFFKKSATIQNPPERVRIGTKTDPDGVFGPGVRRSARIPGRNDVKPARIPRPAGPPTIVKYQKTY